MGQEVWCGNTATPSCTECGAETPCSKVPQSKCPGNHTEMCGGDYLLHVISFDCKPLPGPSPPPPPPTPPPPPPGMAGLSIRWATVPNRQTVPPSSELEMIPKEALTPSLPPHEVCAKTKPLPHRHLFISRGPSWAAVLHCLSPVMGVVGERCHHWCCPLGLVASYSCCVYADVRLC